jgi:2-polyprenyl-3-methyl-5-hydroxy-6-metoxy-1,4-benzoquinol methylase
MSTIANEPTTIDSASIDPGLPGATATRSADFAAALDAQVAYFAERRPIRLHALDTPYIQRHYRELMAKAALAPGASVCEWGSGLGRFSRLLLAEGMQVSAIELSPQLTRESRQALAGQGPLSVHCGDIVEVLDAGIGKFDAMLGFFVLHHLPELEKYFRSAYQALRPGGRMVFVEPNPFHPLFPVQITLTPGMRWHGERGIYRLTPDAVRQAAISAGFSRIEITRYGALPRAPYNWLARWRREQTIERFIPTMVKPFQTIVAWR